MTKKEEILNNTTGLEDDYGYEFYSRSLVEDMMEKYAKYCAEEAWKEGSANMLRSVHVITFSEFWSEFQRKEATEL